MAPPSEAGTKRRKWVGRLAVGCLVLLVPCWIASILLYYQCESTETPNPEYCGDYPCDLVFLLVMIDGFIPVVAVSAIIILVWLAVTKEKQEEKRKRT